MLRISDAVILVKYDVKCATDVHFIESNFTYVHDCINTPLIFISFIIQISNLVLQTSSIRNELHVAKSEYEVTKLKKKR